MNGGYRSVPIALVVKWFLAIPHYIVLAVLGFAAVVVTVAAGLAILFTGRYPRSWFSFIVGAMRQHNPMMRTGTMEELSNLATFLMTPGACDWMTGQLLFMDGGLHLATGGNFYALREWTDEMWDDARARIEAQNRKDRAQRS